MAVALFSAALGLYAVNGMERLYADQRTLYGDVFGGTHFMATWLPARPEENLSPLSPDRERGQG